MNSTYDCPTARRSGALYTALLLLAGASSAFALGQTQYVQMKAVPGGFAIAQPKSTATIYVDAQDLWGVQRAAGDLQADVHRVTGLTPRLTHSSQLPAHAILIGTIGQSAVIDRLIAEKKIDVSAIRGQWESTLIQIVQNPLPGVQSALVIAGSDKRGTIYGIYDISEEIGVSPWYWWADVPVQHHSTLFVQPGTRIVYGAPAVKYRGIFLNDEAPSLTNWVNAKYGGFNHLFYTKVFELLLRLRANYLWPAMWNSAFNEDDPLNPKLANDYGIVMGTSHHEPMLRSQQEWKRHGKGPWNYATNAEELNDFWTKGIVRNGNYESTITVGMRGDGDKPMAATDDISLLEKIVADQRQIIASHRTPTIASDPQVWALYKEVQGYYEKGMRVPEDVTLLWSDDNWGNIRRLPTPEERKRSGGAGVYYHVDYVGDPRSYKWLNTYSITKIWEQMHLAWQYDATRIWILNVGDLKPMEFPMEFFLTYARNPERWNQSNLQQYTQMWATREFGPEHAAEIADLISTYTQYNARRKPEQLAPDTFSPVHYDEASRVYAEWQSLTDRAEKLESKLPADQRDAYFELVLYPAKASAIVNELYILAGKNHLYAAQGRASTNDLAQQARALFAQDEAMTNAYNHTLAHGKWDHMMDQTHIGYTFWNEPPLNAMPGVQWVQPDSGAHMAVAAEDVPFAVGNAYETLRMLPFDVYNQQTQWLDVFNRGDKPFTYTASADQPWIVLSAAHGAVDKDQRLQVQMDWSQVPVGEANGTITFTQTGGTSVHVRVQALHPAAPARDALDGFVEARNYVSIEAAHTTATTTANDVRWVNIPGYGETLSAMTTLPVTAASVLPPQPSASLQYKMYLFTGGDYQVQAILAPTLNFVPGRGLRYAISFDDQPPQIVDALAHNSDADWAKAVSDGVRKVTATLSVQQPGYHTLKFWRVDPGVVLEKLVVSQGRIPESSLGPPESYHTMHMKD